MAHLNGSNSIWWYVTGGDNDDDIILLDPKFNLLFTFLFPILSYFSSSSSFLLFRCKYRYIHTWTRSISKWKGGGEDCKYTYYIIYHTKENTIFVIWNQFLYNVISFFFSFFLNYNQMLYYTQHTHIHTERKKRNDSLSYPFNKGKRTKITQLPVIVVLLCFLFSTLYPHTETRDQLANEKEGKQIVRIIYHTI